MKTSTKTLIALTASLAALPLAAQAPLFADGAAFGGSRVFSEGLNPWGNPANLEQAKDGIYGTWLQGDQEAGHAGKAFKNLGTENPPVVSSALRDLDQAPWTVRNQAWGMALIERGVSMVFTREEFATLSMANIDLEPGHLDGGANLMLNTSRVDQRRGVVDRLIFGTAVKDATGIYGFRIRVEHHTLGQRTLGLVPVAVATDPRIALGFDPWAFKTTDRGATSVTADFGLTIPFNQVFQVGLTVDRLIKRRIWDLEEKPQVRVGAMLTFSPMVSLSAEMDVNRAYRFPRIELQRTASASVRLTLGANTFLLLGAERQESGDAFVVRGGASLHMNLSGMHVGLGFQAGTDKPLKGVVLGMTAL